MKNNSLRVYYNKPTGNEPRMLEFHLRDLPFALQSSEIGPPSHGVSRDVIITSDLYSLHLVTVLLDADDLVKVSRIMAYPLTGKFNRRNHEENYLPRYTRQMGSYPQTSLTGAANLRTRNPLRFSRRQLRQVTLPHMLSSLGMALPHNHTTCEPPTDDPAFPAERTKAKSCL